MSEVIDSKIVELKFNNKDFENNVKTSLTTIEKLKKSLNFDTVTTSVGLLQNALQLKGLNNINSQLGKVVSAVDQTVNPIMGTINAIGSAITSTIGGAITGVVNQIKAGGINRAMNIEQAKFSLQGIGIKWEDIGQSINDAVSGTAYGLDQAAKVAATLSASGISLDVIGKDVVDTTDDLTEMEMVLKGISGVAAQTNQDFDSVAHVFSTVAGNGRLMGMQLTQLSTYGMNAAADLGKALGKTESEIREMASKGQIDAKTFFDTMYKLYWKNAAKANETLNGVTSNIKSAYGRIGAAFYSPLIENNGPIVHMLNAYKDVIGTVATYLKPLGTKDSEGKDISGRLVKFVSYWLIKDIKLVTDFLTKINENGDVVKAWRSVYRVLKSGFKIFQATFNFVQSIGIAFKNAFPESILDAWIDINTKLFNFVNIFYFASKNIKKNAKIMTKAFEGIRGVLEPLYENVKNLAGGFKMFFDETFGGLNPLKEFSKFIRDICGYLHVGVIETEDWYNGFKSIWKIVELVYGVFSAFGQAVYETFTEGNFHPMKYFIELLQILTNGLVTNDKTTNRLKNTFKIFTTAVGIVAKVLGIALKIVAQFINWGLRLVGVVLLLTSPIGTLVSKVFELATGFGEAIRNLDLSKYEHLSGLIESIGGFFKTAKDKLFDFAGEISDFASNELGSISLDWPKAFDGVLGALDNIIQKADSIKDKLKNGIGKSLETLKTNIDRTFGKDSRDNMEKSETILERLSKIDILETLGKGVKTVGDVFKDLIDAFKSSKLLTAIGKDIGGFITEITKSLAGSLDMATSDNVMENVKKIFETFGEVLGIVFRTIGQIVDSFSEGVAKYGSSEEVSKTVDNAMEIISGLTLFNWSRSIANISSLAKTGRDPIIKYFNTVASVMESIGKSMIMITFALYLMQQATQQPGWDEARIVLTEYMVLIVAISTFFMQMTKGNAVAGLQVSLKKWKDLKIKKPEFIMSQILGVIIALAIYAIAIAGALKIMSGCDPDTLERNFNLLAGVMILTVVIAGVMAKVTPKLNKNKESVVSMGPLIKSIAVAMLIMAFALSILGKIPFKRLAAGTGALAVLSIIIGVIIYALLALIKSFARTKGGNFSSYSKDGGQNGLGFKIAALAGLVLSIAIAGLIMAQAVAMLGLLPKKVLIKGAVTLVALLVVMGLIVAGLTRATKESKLSSAATMGSIAAVILATAGACIVLAIAMAMFSKVPWKGIGRGLAAFAGAMAIVLLVAGAIKAFKLEAAMTSLALTLLSFGAVAIMISAAIWLLAKAFIALGKEGPAAVAGAAVLFYSIGKGIGWVVKGLADAVEDILQGVWDICVAIGEFLVEKIPVIVEFLGGLMLDIVDYLVPGSKAAFTKLFDYIFSGENFKLYAGNISDALVKEIQDTRKRIEDENKELTKKFEEADKETDYYSGLWDRLQRITTESGRVKTGYEDEAKELIDELNPALETNLKLQDDIIQNYKDVRDEIDLTLAKKKAEAYTEAYTKQLKEDVEQELVTMQQVREASDALDKTKDDLKKNKDQISAFDTVDKKSKSDLRHWFLDVNEIFDESTGQMVEFSRAKFDSMLDANGNVTEDLIRAAELTQNMLKERTGAIEDQIVKEEGYLEEATTNHDDYVNRIARGNELLEVSQTGTAEEIEDAMLKQRYLFKDVNNSTKKELYDQTEAYKKGLDDINKLLKDDPYNANYKKKQEEYLKLLGWAREEERKERGKTTKEIEKDTKESQLAQAETQRQKQDEINQKLWKEKKKRIKKAKKEGQDVITAEYEGMDEEVQNLDWTSINSKMEEAGLNSGDYFANGTVDALGTAELMHDFELKGYDLGEMFGGGFVGGIKSKFGEVFNIGSLLGQTAESGTKKSTKIESPSKVMMQNGKYFVQGFVNGISDSIGSAKKASEKLGEAVVNAFENYDLNADYTPTITPVVDLSNVHSAAGSINSLFGSRSLSLASSAGMISSSMREIQNNDPNAGLISAINGLTGTTNNNVYNVNGITYDDGSNIADAVGQLINAAMIERRM